MPISDFARLEQQRDRNWLRNGGTAAMKGYWRALLAQKQLSILPGESVLEFGAGSGLWTEHLVSVLRGENPVTAVVFDAAAAEALERKRLKGVRVVRCESLDGHITGEPFDYIVGDGLLMPESCLKVLHRLHQAMKPAGELFLFQPNLRNPVVWAREVWRRRAVNRGRMRGACERVGFLSAKTIPFDIVPSPTPFRLAHLVQSKLYPLEHFPIFSELCCAVFLRARKSGDEGIRRRTVSLADHKDLAGSVSVVVPCRNEEPNVPRLIARLIEFYDAYLHEIIVVDDGSSDGTAAVTRAEAAKEPRVRLISREPPNGVGLALREGYAAATGRYILSMDCDFHRILPEFRLLFDVIAAGHDGAIGSRFSHYSVMADYPVVKMICNRLLHLALKQTLRLPLRDVTNNLKLYRTEIFQRLPAREPHFAVNLEIGLMPLLAGFDIKEVPVSWINRTADMGSSSFKLLRSGPSYVRAAARIMRMGRPLPLLKLDPGSCPDTNTKGESKGATEK